MTVWTYTAGQIERKGQIFREKPKISLAFIRIVCSDCLTSLEGFEWFLIFLLILFSRFKSQKN